MTGTGHDTAAADARGGPTVCLRLHGELDITTRDATYLACTAVRGAAVVVDLSDVSFLDSAGSLAFLQARRRLERHGGSLLITGARGEPARLLAVLDGLEDEVEQLLDERFQSSG